MTPRQCSSLIAALASVALVAVPVSSPAQTASKTASPALRGPDGKPDLQGFWDFRTLTPLQRPTNLGDKKFLTEGEAAALQDQNADRRNRAATPSDVKAGLRAPGGEIGRAHV